MSVLAAAVLVSALAVPVAPATAKCLVVSPTDPTQLCVEVIGHGAAHGWFEPADQVGGHLKVTLYEYVEMRPRPHPVAEATAEGVGRLEAKTDEYPGGWRYSACAEAATYVSAQLHRVCLH